MSDHQIRKKLSQGTGHTVANRLFADAWRETIAYNRDFYERTGQAEAPLWWGERSSTSALLEGLRKAGALVLPEIPVSRKRRGYEPTAGRVDAWVWTEQATYYIEFKHFYYGAGRSCRRKTFGDCWQALHQQVRTMKSAVRADAVEKPAWICGMMLVSLYREANTPDKACALPEGWDDEFLATKPCKEADWIGLWTPTDGIELREFPSASEQQRWSHQPMVALLIQAERFA
ncbi:hypothetical protein [Thiohalocapsa sp. ML1]|uniref:hypothetical protein n=1 Tax=Thiohalocapsa sp. ML1 TaxID=1431688 RepID=UPI0012E35095|nr:hypothetical protein [Thiohalocapsa sp. ML1]